jgi:hypothetical protein
MATPATFRIAGSPIYGAALEIRALRGPWTVWAGAERAAGPLDVHEESTPGFHPRESSPRASVEAYYLGALWAGRRTEAILSGTWDRSRLPFVAFAPLGVETAAFQEGFHPESIAREIFAVVTVRHAIARIVRLRASLRLGYGRETVSLTDPDGARPSRRIEVDRRGIYGAGHSRFLGSPEATLFLGADCQLDLKR